MKVIGITGGVGSGKTQVLEYLNNKYGATMCQTDKIAKKLQKKGAACYEEIVKHFGEEILDARGELDREKLADIVFTDKDELNILNQIVHPAVKEEVCRKIKSERRKNTNLFLLESALLIEEEYDKMCDEVWYVHVDMENRKRRLVYARGYSSKKVEDIISTQLSKSDYMKNCDRVIDNSGFFGLTIDQLDEIVKCL